MIDSLILDFLILTLDAMAGQALPVLFAVTLHNIDPYLLGTMVLLGAAVGAVLNVYKTSRPSNSFLCDYALQLTHSSLAAALSISFAQRILQFLHPAGTMIGTIPAFWVIMHPLANKPISLLAMFILTMALFYCSLIMSPDMIFDSGYILEHQRQLQAMSRYDWYKMHQAPKAVIVVTPDTTPAPHPLHSVFPAAFYIFTLTAYACSCHQPLYNFANKYCSPSLLFHRGYAVFAACIAALFKAYIIVTIAWMQYNILHLLIENNTVILWPLRLYLAILLLSANWHVSHAATNLLPPKTKTKYILALFSLAYMYTWTSFQYFFPTLTALYIITTTAFVCFF